MEKAGQRLRVLRQKRGLSLEDIGKVLNCSVATVSRIETDKNKTLISVDYLNKLADFYNVDVSYIIEGYQYPREFQNASFSAEEVTEEIEIRNLVQKLNSEQITDTIKYIKYLLSQNE
ncbi:MAG: Helix-turn-helix domain [Bacillales bacterium]|nr:Helix-turn-helix domain [Bacillales bacterium]